MPNGSRTTVALLLAAGLLAGSGCQLVRLIGMGDEQQLRPVGVAPGAARADRPDLLVLALDGVDRDLLYGMLLAGELPALAALLGGQAGGFPHAHFDSTLLSTLPSSTMTAWPSAFTGVAPGENGHPGNEFFVRERRELVASVPVTFDDHTPTVAAFTADYVNDRLAAPTVYERLRARDPALRSWVAMHPVHRGATRLLLTHRTVLAGAFRALLESAVHELAEEQRSWAVYEALDQEIVDVVSDALADPDDPPPDLLTLYLPGIDQYAHVSDLGPDLARRRYLREVIDPLLGRLHAALAGRGALEDRYVVVVSDHGHTEVLEDDHHALQMEGPDEPPALLRRLGYRVRPFRLQVAPDDDFNAVVTYQGAMAFVYLGDRSTCPDPGQVCDWIRPPRYQDDVLAVADAFWRNDRVGHLVPAMRGTLDLVLARPPRPYWEEDAPLQVYAGGGRLVSIEEFLAAHPRPEYVALEERLRELATGRYGDRAGDVVLLARNGAEPTPAGRYYFSGALRSWHGSPSARDSELPLIVAHRGLPAARIRATVERALGGPRPRIERLTPLLEALRFAEDDDGP